MGRWLLASVLTWQKAAGGYSLRREPRESLSLNRGGACHIQGEISGECDIAGSNRLPKNAVVTGRPMGDWAIA